MKEYLTMLGVGIIIIITFWSIAFGVKWMFAG